MARYTPGPVDDQIVGQELQKIAQAIDTPDQFLTLEKLYALPTKYRDGTIIYADGTTLDRGSGEGAYIYYALAWHHLG